MLFSGPISTEWAFAALIAALGLLVRSLRGRFIDRSFQTQHHCKPPQVVAPVRDPIFGLDFVYENLICQPATTYLNECLDAFRSLGKTYVVQRWTWKTIQTCDSRNIKHVLATRFQDFALPELRIRAIRSFLGLGIFSLNGHSWAQVRAVLRPGFSKQKIDGMLGMVEEHVQTLLPQIPYKGEIIDLQPLFFEFAMDVATEFLMGHSTSELQAASRRSSNHQFVIDYHHCSEAVIRKMRLGPLQWFVRSKAADEAKVRVFDFVDRFIEEATSQPKAVQSDDEYDVLQELQAMTKDRETLRDQVLHVLLASRDTVACLMSNLFFVLARKPEIYAKLRQEILGRVGSREPTKEELKDMQYLKWCLNESLRLHPIIPNNAREAVVDTTLPYGGGPDGNSPLYVKKGMLVMFNTHAMQRNREVYGDEPDDFVPERWSWVRPGWDYLPFSGGARVCIGQQFALVETSYAVARLVQRFASLEPRDSREWEESDALAVTCKNGVIVSLIADASMQDSTGR